MAGALDARASLTKLVGPERNLGKATHVAGHHGHFTSQETKVLRGLRRKANRAKHEWGNGEAQRGSRLGQAQSTRSTEFGESSDDGCADMADARDQGDVGSLYPLWAVVSVIFEARCDWCTQTDLAAFVATVTAATCLFVGSTLDETDY